MFDIGTAGEDAFQIHPLPLYVDPDVEENVDTIEFFLP